MEFKVGDKAIYPKQGVTEVVSIEVRKIGTATMEFYVLRPLDAKNNVLFVSIKNGEKAGPNPWGATTLEWQTSSPPPLLNFDVPPVVTTGPYDFTARYAKGKPEVVS